MQQRMFSKIKKQLDAAQRFLSGLKSLASFDLRVSEYATLLKEQIEQSENWSTAEGSEILALLDDSLWGSESVNLRELIASRCVLRDGETSKTGKERRPLQDFLNLPLYLTHDLWLKLLGGNMSFENKWRSCSDTKGHWGSAARRSKRVHCYWPCAIACHQSSCWSRRS